MFVESHAHYDDERYDPDRVELLSSLRSEGVDTLINIGADMESTEQSLKLADEYDFIYAAVGVHPHAAKSLNEENLAKLAEFAQHKKCVAIGEIGLDYHYDHSPRDVQRHWFVRQLELAEKCGKPVVIHCREADGDTFDIITQSPVREGVIHCYSGSLEMARDYLTMGFYLGIGGVVTFPKAKQLLEVVENIPLDRILLETDCPYLAPVPHRGERNESKYLRHIAQKIADIKGETLESVAKTTTANAKKVFGL